MKLHEVKMEERPNAKVSTASTTSLCSRNSRPSLDNIPTELLELIISSVRRISLRDFAPLLRVCRKWHDLSLSLVWQNGVLTKSNISSFTNILTKHAYLALRPRSLTLDIHLSYDEYSLTYKVAEYIKRLIITLPNMHHLETFSLKHHVDQSSPYPSSAMTNDLILGLVSALPLSVRNLEIDSAVMYFTQHTGSQCLCSTLSIILPRLSSLRLAYPRICSKLLDKPSSTLQYLVINGIMQHFRPGIRDCDVAGEQARLSWDALQEQRITISIATVRNFLRTVQQKIFNESAAIPASSAFFPRLKNLVVLEPYYFIPGGRLDFFLTNVHSVTPDDNNNKTSSSSNSSRIISQCFPTWVDDLFQYFILRHCAHPAGKATPHNPYSASLPNPPDSQADQPHQHNCSHHDIGGSFAELRTMLEGSAGWTTTAHNARSPQYLRTQTEPLAIDPLDIDVEANDCFEQCLQHRHQAQFFPRQAWCTSTPTPITTANHKNSTTTVNKPVYTVFRCLDRLDPTDTDVVRRVDRVCRCQKCERSRNGRSSDALLTSATSNADNSRDNGEQWQPQHHHLWDPMPMERFFANNIWRAEAEAEKILLCGRVFDTDDHKSNGGIFADLKPLDFELQCDDNSAV